MHEQMFYSTYSRKISLAFFDPDYIGKKNKPNFDTFTDGSFDHLLSVKVKISLNFKGNAVQNVH